MNCRQTEQRLHELLDSRQDIESDDQLRAHLDDCSECNTLAAAYDTLAHAAPRHEEPSPLRGLANRVLAEVGTTSRAPGASVVAGTEHAGGCRQFVGGRGNRGERARRSGPDASG